MSFVYDPIPASVPTLAGFQQWVYDVVGIPQDVLAPGSIYFTYAYDTAYVIVPPDLACVGGPLYLQAVYNLGADNLINWAPDPSPVVPYPTKNPDQLGWMAYLRQQFKLNQFVPGVISASNDVSTGQTIEVVESLKNLTMAQLQNLKTPYGQRYLQILSSMGPVWGIS